MKNCPKCHSQMIAPDLCDDCGWTLKLTVVEKRGPDYAWIADQREAGIKRAMETYTGPRACQERTCRLRAVPGLDYCNQHAQMPESQIRRVGLQHGARLKLPKLDM